MSDEYISRGSFAHNVAMSREELLRELRALEDEPDEERAHVKADELLLKYIDDEEISEAFDEINKWYA